jgi:hypothetical protein
LAELTRQTNLSSSIRLQQLQLQLTSLLHRLLRVVASLPNVNSVVSGGPETSRDIDTREKLIGVQNELDGKGRLIKSSHSGPIGVHTPKRRTGGGEGRLLGQVNELWGAIEELRRRRRGVGLNGDGEQFDKYQLDRIAEVSAAAEEILLLELMSHCDIGPRPATESAAGVDGVDEGCAVRLRRDEEWAGYRLSSVSCRLYVELCHRKYMISLILRPLATSAICICVTCTSMYTLPA